MEDLLGFGKSTDKIIEAVSMAVGAIYRPHGMRRVADAEAYRLLTLGRAKAEVIAAKKQIPSRSKSVAMIVDDIEAQLEERIQQRLAHQATRQQLNIDSVVQAAIDEGTSSDSPEEVDLDWLNNFFDLAKDVSVNHMQDLWGKVLAREIGKPGSFTIRSLEILKRMTRREAVSFALACNYASRFSDDTKKMILTGWSTEAVFFSTTRKNVDLPQFGIGFLERKNLSAIGLLYDGDLFFGPFEKDEEVEVVFPVSTFVLHAKKARTRLTMVQFTDAGSELLGLVRPEENNTYISALHQILESKFTIVKGLQS